MIDHTFAQQPSDRKTWAVVPIKQLHRAKQRLTSCLSAGERRLLAVTMLGDVLLALSKSSRLAGFSVVTGDATVIALAKDYGAGVIETQADCGQSAALYQATGLLADTGVSRVMILPGDTPLVTAAEIDAVASSMHSADSVTVVANCQGTGTNCMASFLPLPIPLAFGLNSFPQHCSFIEDAGLKVVSLALEGLTLDIDTRDDLLALRQLTPRTHTQKLLAGHQFGRRLPATAGPLAGHACSIASGQLPL